MRVSMIRPFILHGIGPVTLGGIIYIMSRTEHLRMFHWAQIIGLKPFIDAIREYAIPFSVQLPSWVIFNLPDALWVYGLTALMILIWANKAGWIRWFFLLIGPTLGIGGELCQAFSWAPGTFDRIDFLLVSAASVVPFINLYTRRDD